MSELPVIVLDPGHGGVGTGDDGAMWPTFAPKPGDRDRQYVEARAQAEILEDATALQIAQETALSLHGLRVACELTRYDDEHVSLRERAQLAQKYGADLVISIHLNAGPPTLHGADVFFPEGDRTSARVADAIARAMPPRLFTNRRHAVAPLPHWTGRAYNVMAPHVELHHQPTVLVECCYLTAEKDRALVKTPWGRATIVNALRAGIVEFCQLREAA